MFIPLSCFILSPPRVPQNESTYHASCDTDATEDGDSHEPFLGDLVIDELAEVGGLEVCRLLLHEEVVVAAGFGIVAELVVAEG